MLVRFHLGDIMHGNDLLFSRWTSFGGSSGSRPVNVKVNVQFQSKWPTQHTAPTCSLTWSEGDSCIQTCQEEHESWRQLQHGSIDEVSRQLACKTGIGWTLALDCYKFMILGVEASIIVILLNSWSLIYYYLTNIVNNVIDFELSWILNVMVETVSVIRSCNNLHNVSLALSQMAIDTFSSSIFLSSCCLACKGLNKRQQSEIWHCEPF